MTADAQDAQYRQLIDRLVANCRRGQGQVGASKVRQAIWNANATPDFLPDQYAVNVFLKGLSAQHRELVASLLADSYASGTHDALVALHEAEMPPFDKGYEGDPFHDFVGRMDDWEWPEGETRF